MNILSKLKKNYMHWLIHEVRKVRLLDRLGGQGIHYDAKELFEPNTKTIESNSDKNLKRPTPE